jgi:redox-sensing transcriptional repressor
MPVGTRRGIPEATVARLPIYHRVLTSLNELGVETVSSEELASASGVSSAKLRKDLSHLGSYGTRGVGYDVEFLVNLGRALANYGGFASRGFRIVGLLDADPNLVGKDVALAPGMRVRHLDELERVVREAEPAIAVIATPAEAAQAVCDRVVAVGMTSILNFAPVVLAVPDRVEVRKVDLATELQILAFHEQRRTRDDDLVGSVGGGL